MDKENNSWTSENELRGFIDMALHFGIDGVFNNRTKDRPFSIFTNYAENSRRNYDLFANQLNNKLTENDNWKAIGIDLNSRFLVEINQYINWYNVNESKFDKFQPYCPYSLMLNIIISTKEEILKYFPEFKIDTLPPLQSAKDELNENTESNDVTISTIEDWLFEFKEQNILTEPNYTNLLNALSHYFKNGQFPKLNNTIKVRKVNKKLLGWHLNRIFHSMEKGIEIDLLIFAKTYISTFIGSELDENNIQKSNLYKYFTTKTK